MQAASVKEKIEFLALAAFAQWVGLGTFMVVMLTAISGVA